MRAHQSNIFDVRIANACIVSPSMDECEHKVLPSGVLLLFQMIRQCLKLAWFNRVSVLLELKEGKIVADRGVTCLVLAIGNKALSHRMALKHASEGIAESGISGNGA